MSKENSTLTIIQTQAIQHLLEGNDLKSTSLMLEKSQSTLTRWMKNPCFISALNDGKQVAFQEAGTRLAKSSYIAASELEKIMLNGEREETRLKAACSILDYALKLSEHVDLVQRIQLLESAINLGVDED